MLSVSLSMFNCLLLCNVISFIAQLFLSTCILLSPIPIFSVFYNRFVMLIPSYSLLYNAKVLLFVNLFTIKTNISFKSTLLHSIKFNSIQLIYTLFNSTVFYSILFYSIYLHPIQFHFILFNFILFN